MPTALIVQGNTITDPKFRDGDAIKTFDYVVANPPFSDKRWSITATYCGSSKGSGCPVPFPGIAPSS
jgi:type I restriction-modification system DNA methylase subunit